MKGKRSHTYGKEYQAVEQAIESQQKKLSFTFNLVFLTTAVAAFFELYWALTHKKLNYFVMTSLLIDIAYPFIFKLKYKNASLLVLFTEGTLLSSLLYDCWTLAYPQKVFVYYVPLLLGSISKIYHMIGGDCLRQVDEMVQQLSKFQSKIEILVMIYGMVAFVMRLKFSWGRVIKLMMFLLVFRLKYWHHYGTQQAWHQIHLSLDSLSRTLLVRSYYHQIYSRFMKIGNAMNQRKVIIL